MNGLREIWTEMQKIWSNIENIKDMTIDVVSV